MNALFCLENKWNPEDSMMRYYHWRADLWWICISKGQDRFMQISYLPPLDEKLIQA